eukprot:2111510-Prymnesium_polylepis.1
MLACCRLGSGGQLDGPVETGGGPTCRWKLGCDSGLEGGPPWTRRRAILSTGARRSCSNQ